MFPELPKETIKDTFSLRKENLEDTIHDLLCLNTLSAEERDLQVLEYKPYVGGSEAKKAPKNQNDSGWKSLNDNLQIIMEYGGVSKKLAHKLYCDQHFDSIKALIQLIFTYEELIKTGLQDSKEPRDTATQSKKNAIVLKSRVQNFNGFAYGKPSKETIEDSMASQKDIHFAKNHTYKYEFWNEQSQALEECIKGEPKLKTINHKFLEKALEFYDGNVEKTLALAIIIVERKYGKFTNKFRIDLQNGKQSISNHTDYKPAIKYVVQKNAPKPPVATVHLRDPNRTEIAQTMIENILISNVLDFHGFFPEDAEVITAASLKKWWSKEMSARELHNQRLNQIEVLNVPRITIITGRGLHSVGGVPKVRQRIKKFLNYNNYVFTEEPSFFVVKGKRR